MIEASKTAELSSQPRKRGRKAWMIGLACVVAVATIVLLATPPKPEPVKVWFVRATNEFGGKRLLFEGTNGMAREIWFAAGVFTRPLPHGATLGVSPADYGSAGATVEAGTNFDFTLDAPSNDVPYYVMWQLVDIPGGSTRWGRLRIGCYKFFLRHGKPGLARPFFPMPELHCIPSTEIKE